MRVVVFLYRVKPEEEKDVKSSLNPERLKTGVRQLKLNKNIFAIQVINAGLSDACKKASARENVLYEQPRLLRRSKE